MPSLPDRPDGQHYDDDRDELQRRITAVLQYYNIPRSELTGWLFCSCPKLAKLAERFGSDILAADGSLDRAALAAKAFVSDDTKRDLDAITHPAIGEEFLRRVAAAPPDGVVIHDVPLLVESTRGYEYAAVIVVESPLEVRLERLEQRGVDREDARRRISMQATDDERRKVATWVVDNSGDLAHLEAQVDAIWHQLEQRAAKG